MKSTIFVLATSIGVFACGGAVAPNPDGQQTTTSGTEPAPGPGDGPTSGGSGSGSASGSAGPSGSTPGTAIGAVSCGTASCNAASEVCCIGFDGGSSTSSGAPAGMKSSCTAKNACDRQAALSCSSAANCTSAQVCCLTFAGFGGGTSSGGSSSSGGGGGDLQTAECKTTCGASGPSGSGSIQLCASDAECANGQTCRSDVAGMGISFCMRPGKGGGSSSGSGGGGT